MQPSQPGCEGTSLAAPMHSARLADLPRAHRRLSHTHAGALVETESHSPSRECPRRHQTPQRSPEGVTRAPTGMPTRASRQQETRRWTTPSQDEWSC